MKVLLINPWGVNNDQFYTAGFIHGMNAQVKLSFASNYYYGGEKPNDAIYRVFFQKSEKMPHTMKRKVIRGIEYIDGWRKILKIVQEGNFDVIHIHWLLMYRIDLRYVPKVKKYCKKLILTAHNIIPHINGEKSVGNLRKLYSYFDTILLHGETLKEEFNHYFPELSNRLHVQYHGEYFGQSTECCSENNEIVLKLLGDKKEYKKTFIMYGNHFYNKGSDRVLKSWITDKRFDDYLLVVAGRINKNYSQMQQLIPEAKKRPNILILDCFVEDDLLNYLITKSNVVVIPYRHASMSGVLHTAAVFEKPVICTKVGALDEYLENGKDSIVCENTDEAVHDALLMVVNLSTEKLNKMGIILHDNINHKYSWEKIAVNLYNEVYVQQ